ncbi:MAG: phosphotransferase [Gammaproteobacteria bacterium]|nr:phosphotransferase [Gammaproteobacteria bacterium]
MGGGDIESRYTKAAWEALAHFPVEAERLSLVSQSENITFRVSVLGGGKDYVLRLHRPGYSSIEELESERIWVRALKETGVAVPCSIETDRGGHYVLVDIPGAAEKRYVGMTTWQEGKPLRNFIESCPDDAEKRRVFRRFGAIAATFHDQSTRWQPPPGFVRRRLDLDALLGEAPFWGRFWEHRDLDEAERELLLHARASMHAALGTYGETPDNFSLIHADFTPDNVIYNDGDLAVIDFDDSAYGWHMYDIASALIECQFGQDCDSLQSAFLDGYRECRPLAQQDIEMFRQFELIRGMAIIGWFHQRPEYAGEAEFEKVRSWVIGECQQ